MFIELIDKNLKMAYKVEAEVEPGMSHVFDEFELAIRFALGKESEGMFIRDKSVFHSVYEKEGTGDVEGVFFVVESFL